MVLDPGGVTDTPPSRIFLGAREFLARKKIGTFPALGGALAAAFPIFRNQFFDGGNDAFIIFEDDRCAF